MTIDPIQYARRWKTLGVLSLSLVIIGLDNTILNVALPTLQDEFDASPSKLQWMVDSYLLVFAGLLLVFGTLGDRFGRKLALQAGVSIFGLASLGALVADSANEVIAVRAAMGVGAALIMPATLSIIANVFSGEERGKAIGIWAAVAAVGIGLGPLTGGLLLEWFDWSSVFMVNVPFALAALLLGIRYVPESRDPRPGSFDLLGAALSTAGFSILVYAIIEAPEHGWTSGLVLGSLAASIALLGFFVWWERRIAEPMLDLGFFRSARFSVGTAAVSTAFFALLGGIFALTQYLQFVHGYSAIEAGAIMSPMALGLMIGAGSSSKAVHKLGISRVVAVGLTGLATLLALTVLWEQDTGALLLAAWFFGLALAMGWVMAPATDAVVGAVPAAKSASRPRRTPSHAWSREHSVLRSSGRSSALSTRATSKTRSALYLRRLRKRPRARSALLTRSPRNSHPRRPPGCSRRPATPSPARWASASWSRPHSPPLRPLSWLATCRRARDGDVRGRPRPLRRPQPGPMRAHATSNEASATQLADTSGRRGGSRKGRHPRIRRGARPRRRVSCKPSRKCRCASLLQDHSGLQVRRDRCVRSEGTECPAHPRPGTRDRPGRADCARARLRRRRLIRTSSHTADALRHRLARQVLHRSGDHAAGRGGKDRSRRTGTTVRPLVPCGR